MSAQATQPYYQTNRQLMVFGLVMFGAIMAAVIASTMIVMSLMNGQIAGALEKAATKQAPVAGYCQAPVENDDEAASTKTAPKHEDTAMPVHYATWPVHSAPVSNSFVKTTNTNTTNNVTNNTSTINDNSYTDNSIDNSKGKTIITDNSVDNSQVNQNGLVNINSQDKSKDVSITNVIDNPVTTNITKNSNNVIDSFNTVKSSYNNELPIWL